MFWVYILQNAAGQFYVGHTDSLSTRLANHNRTDKIDGKFTRKNGPWIRENLLNGGVSIIWEKNLICQ